MAGLRELPAGLRGPVDLALLRPAETIPRSSALPGGCRYELKFDGYRAALVRTKPGAKLWSRQGRDLSPAFPDLIAAAEFHLKPGTVLDGEACALDGQGRLSFDLLQARMARRHGPAIAAAAREHPASYVAFDLLALDYDDLRDSPLRSRRAQLERVCAKWAPPVNLSPVTGDYEEAVAWFDDYRPTGVEGIVVKAAAGRYRPGSHDWIKVKNRETREVILGAVTGTLQRPAALVVGLVVDDRLVIVGRSTELTPAQSRQVAAAIAAAGADHPWPDEVASGVFGVRRTVAITKTHPLVVEVSADTGLQAGRYRHPVRFVRLRADLEPADIETLELS